jgi:acyl carrier protein
VRATIGLAVGGGRVVMAQGATIRERIRAFVVDAFFVDDFTDEELFVTAGIIDSMGMVQLVAFLEAEFEIDIQEEDLVPENLDSLARATAFVTRKINRSAA